MRGFEIIPLFLLLCLPSFGRQEDAEKVYATVSGSVVGLENAEGGGTGILIDEKGAILTNAHVITSPLSFKAKVEAPKGKEKETLVYKKVELVGIHPKYDLALVRLDPKEHPAKLKPVKLCRDKPGPGRKVYAIGNPAASGIILAKTITEGMLSGEREFTGLKYYQFSAQVNPGNSGGPLCDKKGEVLGLVTFKLTDADGVGFAIPLGEFKAADFVPLNKRGADPRAAREWIDAGEKYGQKGHEMGEKYGLEDEQRKYYNFLAVWCYREAISFDPANPDIYYNAGMFWRTLDQNAIAVAYLVRSIRIKPWPDHDPDYPYRELGYSLVKLNRRPEARIVWNEGLAKFPSAAGKICEDMSIFSLEEKNCLEAAWSAHMALRLGKVRENVMKQLYAEAKKQLNAADATTLEAREKETERTIKEQQTAADEAKKKKEYMHKEFEDLLKKLESE